MHGRNSGPSNAGISKARRACDIRDGAIAVPPPRNGPVGRHVYLQRSDQKGINFSGCRAVVPACHRRFLLGSARYVVCSRRLTVDCGDSHRIRAEKRDWSARSQSIHHGLSHAKLLLRPELRPFANPTNARPWQCFKSEARIKERRHFAPWRHEDCATIFCSSPSTQPFR